MNLKQIHLSATSKEIGKLASLCHCLLERFNLPSTAPVRNIKGNRYLDLINSLYFVLSFDSSHGFSANQKDVEIPTLTEATPTIDNGLNLLLLTFQKSP